MQRILLSDNFWLDEFIDKKTYMYHFNEGTLWKLPLLIDKRIIEGIQVLRDMLGIPIIINDWWNGGEREWSGYRIYGSEFYNMFSAHSNGRGVDFICSMDSDLVRRFIKTNWHIFKEYFTRMEINITWVHLDCNYVYDNREPYLFSK